MKKIETRLHRDDVTDILQEEVILTKSIDYFAGESIEIEAQIEITLTNGERYIGDTKTILRKS